MAKILAPNKQYNGLSAGVQFSNGVADCGNPYLIDWFKSKGYGIELDAAELKLPVPEPEEPAADVELAPELQEEPKGAQEVKTKRKRT